MNPKIVPLETDEDWEVFEKVLKPMGYKLQLTAFPIESYTIRAGGGWIPFDEGWSVEAMRKIGSGFSWRAIYE